MPGYRCKLQQLAGEHCQSIQVDFSDGICFEILTYGGIIRQMLVPDFQGKRENVILSLPDLASYRRDSHYIGCLVGRYASRIAGASFELDGHRYQLSNNEGNNHLHGGYQGFGKVIWKLTDIDERPGEVELVLEHLSPDGQEGYPGDLKLESRYLFRPSGLEIRWTARCDVATIYNPTHHSYFNLSGDPSRQIDDHELQLGASAYLLADDELLPIGDRDQDEFCDGKSRLLNKSVLDRAYLLKSNLAHSAILNHKSSGRSLRLKTDRSCLQVYTGDYLDGSGFASRSGICLEPQAPPNSPNSVFKSEVIVKPDLPLECHCSYEFGLSSR